LPPVQVDSAGTKRWTTFLAMRELVMKALEEQRAAGVIRSPLEARVTLLVSDASLKQLVDTHAETLTEVFVVSGVRADANGTAAASGQAGSVPGLTGVNVERAPGEKCQRCWKFLESVGSHAAHPTICDRCARVVSHAGPPAT